MNQKTAPWYTHSFRRNLVDMHIEDWNDEFLSQFDPHAYFDCLKTAKIQSPMIYLHSHVGLCNWDSPTGKVHNAFKSENKIKTLIDLCHAEGMDVIGYYSLLYNCVEYERHPDWRMLDTEGNPSRRNKAQGFMSGGRHGNVCPNNQDYRAFLVKQFEEMVACYDLEGVFLDMTFWPMVCTCSCCRTRFKNETGFDIPTFPDWQNPIWMQFQACRENWMGEFADFCTAVFRKQDITVEHQLSTLHNHWQFGVTERVNDASDYTGGDLYGGHSQESFICKMYYEITNHQPFEYMTSRCEPGLWVHTTTKSLDVLRLHNFLTLAHHGAMLFIDAIDPVGTMDKHVYEDIGRVFEESIPYEKYLTKGALFADAALYYDLKSKFNSHPESGQYDTSIPQLDAALGASIALSDDRIMYTVIPGGRREKIFDKKAVVVCEAVNLSDDEIMDLVRYVEMGGGLYISGATNPALVKILLDLNFEGFTDSRITYIAPTQAGRDVFGDRFSEEIPLAFDGKQMLVTMGDSKEQTVLATITLPYTDPEDATVFASIHSNPPGIKTAYPAMVYGTYGRGRVVWSAAAFEKNTQKSHKRIWINAFRKVYGEERLLTSDAPSYAQFVLFDDPQEKCLYLHVVNVQETDEIVPLLPFCCSVNWHSDIEQVVGLPDERMVSVENGTFTVDGLDIFRMYRLCYR